MVSIELCQQKNPFVICNFEIGQLNEYIRPQKLRLFTHTGQISISIHQYINLPTYQYINISISFQRA